MYRDAKMALKDEEPQKRKRAEIVEYERLRLGEKDPWMLEDSE
jgi:hypothetical protein